MAVPGAGPAHGKMYGEGDMEAVRICDVVDELPGMRLDEEEMLFHTYSPACSWTPPADMPSPPADTARAEKHVEREAEALSRKRASRLERNRQSAQNLRERKRLYTERVEAELEASKAQVVQLRSQVSALTAENGVLRQENGFLRGVLRDRSNSAPLATSTPPPSWPASKRARRAGAMALSVAAVLGLVACQQSAPQIGGAYGAAETTTHRSMLERDDPATLALPDYGKQDTTATATGGEVTPVPSLSQALLPYVHDNGESAGATLDWPALCQLGALQLGSDRYILLPFSELQELGRVGATRPSISVGRPDWQQQVASPPVVPIHPRDDFSSVHASGAVVVHAMQKGLVTQDAMSRSGKAAQASSTLENDGYPAKPTLEHAPGESHTSSSSKSTEHIHRVLHMLSSMTKDDRKVMLHLLTSDADEDEQSSSGFASEPHRRAHSQWTAAPPRLSSLSVLLPAMPHFEDGELEEDGEGAAEVVELSCGLARTWRIAAD